jgi:hypothetical protein
MCPAHTAESGSLVVSRDADNDIKMRGLDVFVDGTHVANLAYGKETSLSLDIGEHTLKVSNSLYSKSDSFEIGSGETVRYQAANVGTALGKLLVALGSGLYKVSLKRV